ncbi:class I SAM-dependent methyltransferase [Shewanella avicenniae]|uniref:Class I SAM-dependent methyltransferase n=1 Tax=Shewanella avicenniae TaxID=2814294 RepID=A0ABX7QW02_9GAMM|nr:class I SAM-dependent methyltransferase [Shewanella avicenniae]QSX34808.1 class I SAM-dependent methyltransferase [Shewanella avicenniae]
MNNNYYNQNAQAFFDGTIAVDMAPLYQRFEPYLPAHAKVVDAGCGSGRDTRYFLSRGHDVSAFDASEAMVMLASESSGHKIWHSSFLEFQLPTATQDAVWACASLLHVPTDELTATFMHIAQWLKPDGILYCSFKYGVDVVERDGRRFTNLNEALIAKHLAPTALSVKELWLTSDLRPGRENEQWLNAILIKRTER